MIQPHDNTTTGYPSNHVVPDSSLPPDYITSERAFSKLSRRAQAKILLALLRLRREIDPANGCHAQDAEFLDTELDRLSGLIRGAR
jgi:hypothetical protein